MIVHGGYWESLWLKDLMDPMALDLTARGFITFNVEYTTGEGSCPDAITDIFGAFDHIVENAGSYGLDPDRLVIVGHSAGGFLALHVGHQRSGFAGVVGLAAVVDLDTVAIDCPTDNPVDHFIGGNRIERPDLWEQATIAGTPEVAVRLIHGSEDEFVTPLHAEHYLQMTRGVGTLTMLGGVGHMELIDPHDDVWTEVLRAITETVTDSPVDTGGAVSR
jgi:acetyl esterase/lipase